MQYIWKSVVLLKSQLFMHMTDISVKMHFTVNSKIKKTTLKKHTLLEEAVQDIGIRMS